MRYQVNNALLEYHAEGDRMTGEEKILLDSHIDITQHLPWNATGFSIEPLFSKSLFDQFEKTTNDLLVSLWKQAGIPVPANIQLDQYHTVISQYSDHLLAVDKTKLLSVSDFPVDIRILEERISEICREKLEVKNPYDNQSIFHFRIIRPNTNDNNPLHRDVWLEDYKDCINLYIPVAGSNEESSIILIPESHQWPESKIERTKSGAIVNGVKFNVPAVTAIHGEFQAIRPNPLRNEVLVFSPYLIHGGAINLHPSKTRISMEIRLWKQS